MNIFVLNRGSSTIKCYLYAFENIPTSPVEPLWSDQVEWKNDQGKTASQGLSSMIERIPEKIDAIGHRIVHGGKFFRESVEIDTKVKEAIRHLAELAPLHNLPELEGIEIMEKHFPKIPQIAVFDTAFHHTLPKEAAIYPGPYRWFEEGILRYGFHGISYQYCSRRCAEILKTKIDRMVICHLGSGASLCAIKEGKSIDTTMGFTPLEGLMMDTRSGSVDPGIILHLLEKKKLSPSAIYKQLYQESGLLGISGISSDMRDIMASDTPRAKLAFDIYLHRLNAELGSMIASLKGLDVLVFTAGIGENAALLRKRVCENFAFLGMEIDPEKKEGIISTPHSKVKVVVIHTREAFEIAREVATHLRKEDENHKAKSHKEN